MNNPFIVFYLLLLKITDRILSNVFHTLTYGVLVPSIASAVSAFLPSVVIFFVLNTRICQLPITPTLPQVYLFCWAVGLTARNVMRIPTFKEEKLG